MPSAKEQQELEMSLHAFVIAWIVLAQVLAKHARPTTGFSHMALVPSTRPRYNKTMNQNTAIDPMRVYHDYLLKRSRLGDIYRRFWLYPALCRRLHGKVLDVGCGIGDFLRFRPETVGIDINPHNVNYCRQDGLDAHNAADKFPFPDHAFEGVVLDNVLEHIEDPGPILAEIRRVLKPNGTLLIGVPGRKGYAADPDHKRYYDKLSLCRLVEGRGFKTQAILPMPVALPGLDRLLSLYCLYAYFNKMP